MSKTVARKPYFDYKYEQRAPWYNYINRYNYIFRTQIYKLFEEHIPPKPKLSVLDLGVTDKEVNYFHKLYPYRQKITAAGLAKQNELIKKNFPEIKYRQVSDNFPYPFKDNQFDVVHAAAVIEHVGSCERQKTFMSEAVRIGKCGMISTPNRWFPIELHTYLPLIHWLPTSWYRKIYWFLGMKIFSREENLNLLTDSDLETMANELKITHYWIIKKYTFGLVSNYLFFWRKIS